jgi:Bacterial archaeo-eukaryotic release factor family 3
MTETKLLALEALHLDKIRELIQSPGPCLTLMLPGYRPGELAQPISSVIKRQLQDAERQLRERGVPESTTQDLLAPLRHLAEDPSLSSGSHSSRVVFRSLSVFRQFAVTEPVKPALQVGKYFEILPVLAELHLPAEFYVLCLSKKDVEMFRCSGLHAERVKLPAGVPETLEETLGFKPPDHDLENRAAAGSSASAMHAVRFSTDAGAERQGAYLADFYKAVDRGVRELLGAASEAPLVLAGVEEDSVLYCRSNRYPHLLHQIAHGSKGVAMDPGILLQAYSIVRSEYSERAVRELRASKERVASARYSTSVNSILQAAAEGRVASLYIDEGARIHGALGEQDLLNLVAVETIRQGGTAFAVPSGRIPDGANIAAILRF